MRASLALVACVLAASTACDDEAARDIGVVWRLNHLDSTPARVERVVLRTTLGDRVDVQVAAVVELGAGRGLASVDVPCEPGEEAVLFELLGRETPRRPFVLPRSEVAQASCGDVVELDGGVVFTDERVTAPFARFSVDVFAGGVATGIEARLVDPTGAVVYDDQPPTTPDKTLEDITSNEIRADCGTHGIARAEATIVAIDEPDATLIPMPIATIDAECAYDNGRPHVALTPAWWPTTPGPETPIRVLDQACHAEIACTDADEAVLSLACVSVTDRLHRSAGFDDVSVHCRADAAPPGLVALPAADDAGDARPDALRTARGEHVRDPYWREARWRYVVARDPGRDARCTIVARGTLVDPLAAHPVRAAIVVPTFEWDLELGPDTPCRAAALGDGGDAVRIVYRGREIFAWPGLSALADGPF